MIVTQGGRGPKSRHYNIVCNTCRTPTVLIDPRELNPGAARKALREAGWAYVQGQDYCKKCVPLVQTPQEKIQAALEAAPKRAEPAQKRLYNFDEDEPQRLDERD